MKHRLLVILGAISVLTLTSCSTMVGTAAGAGIGAIGGDTRTGAVIGGSIGLLDDIFN